MASNIKGPGVNTDLTGLEGSSCAGAFLEIPVATKANGKKAGKDAAAGKATLPSLLGAGEARRRAEALCDAAEAQLAPMGAGADLLRALARYVITRRS